MSEVEFITGITKWFDKDKGYGFIRLPGGGLDIFVHCNQLKRSGIERPLHEGEKVKFQTDKNPRKPGMSFAVNISLVKDE